MTLACGIDLGGTKVAIGLVDESGSIVAERTVATDTAGATSIADAARELVDDASAGVVGAGIGVAGHVSSDRRTISFTANVDWPVSELPGAVEDALGVPVVVENDAAAAAWGEYRFGAAAAADHILMATVGTGVGGGLIMGGELVRGGHGISAELGHMLVERDGRPCECGARGCLEQYASGRALVRAVAARGHDVEGREITAAAQRGESFAVEALAEVGGWLGHGLASAAALVDPGLIVVGGGVIEAGDLLLGPAREAFRAGLTAADTREIAGIVPARLGNAAGIIGAADLARRP